MYKFEKQLLSKIGAFYDQWDHLRIAPLNFSLIVLLIIFLFLKLDYREVLFRLNMNLNSKAKLLVSMVRPSKYFQTLTLLVMRAI